MVQDFIEPRFQVSWISKFNTLEGSIRKDFIRDLVVIITVANTKLLELLQNNNKFQILVLLIHCF